MHGRWMEGGTEKPKLIIQTKAITLVISLPVINSSIISILSGKADALKFMRCPANKVCKTGMFFFVCFDALHPVMSG